MPGELNSFDGMGNLDNPGSTLHQKNKDAVIQTELQSSTPPRRKGEGEPGLPAQHRSGERYGGEKKERARYAIEGKTNRNHKGKKGGANITIRGTVCLPRGGGGCYRSLV